MKEGLNVVSNSATQRQQYIMVQDYASNLLAAAARQNTSRLFVPDAVLVVRIGVKLLWSHMS